MQQPARPVSVDHGYTSLYATPDGETHLRRVNVRLEPSDFAPTAQPLLVGEAQPATHCFFLAIPCGWGESDLANGHQHPAPRRLLCTVLRGHIVTYASDGTSVRAGPGEALLLEDVAPAKATSRSTPARSNRACCTVQLAGQNPAATSRRGQPGQGAVVPEVQQAAGHTPDRRRGVAGVRKSEGAGVA
jgi:hypothetical protein